jgi:NAD-dependent SIR2 family protein deacetylase
MSNLSASIDQASTLVSEAKHLVVFTGAGISTESGLPDFRGPDGVWTRRDKGLPPPRGISIRQARPNTGHAALVDLQTMGKLGFLISQNVDGLHLASGIRFQLLAELHGNVKRVRCRGCERTYGKEQPPRRCSCGCKSFASSVINFGDTLPAADLEAAWANTSRADVFLVVGSSLLVTPAADMPRLAAERGAELIIVNVGETALDDLATLRVEAKAGEVLPEMVRRVAASQAA